MHGPLTPFLSGRKTEVLLTFNPCNAILHFHSSGDVYFTCARPSLTYPRFALLLLLLLPDTVPQI